MTDWRALWGESPLWSQRSAWLIVALRLLLLPRWSWRGSAGEAGAARWPWTTSPWGKAPAQRSTTWGDSDCQDRGRQKENKRENHLKEKWLCRDHPSLCRRYYQFPPAPAPTSLSPINLVLVLVHPANYIGKIRRLQDTGFPSVHCSWIKGLNQMS